MTINPNIKTITINESREVPIPFEWSQSVEIDMLGYAQITLVDDRIVIHKPTAAGEEYKSACKVSDDSYIRRIDIIGVRIPEKLLKKLDIKSGDTVDLALEKNCVSIRKNNVTPPSAPESAEPLMAFCCVCGKLFYTDGVVKVSLKYICRNCIELVKSL